MQWSVHCIIPVEGKEVLTVFTEPHAYISPKYYDKRESVPTWNYIAVHAYGKVAVISESGEVFQALEKMIDSFDPGYQEQWNGLSTDYKMKMIKGIVAFQIRVDQIFASEKLSQNKNENERFRIIENLSSSKQDNEKLIGEYMKNKL